jgi:anhydro-N-acetylmuramic acid kinase
MMRFLDRTGTHIKPHSIKPSQRLIIGLMSGTSVDAIDAALTEIRRNKRGDYALEVLAHVEQSWPSRIRERLLAVMAPARTSTREICELNMAVAREFAAAVEDLLRKQGLERQQITAVASHGQTICHLPPKPAAGKSRLVAPGKIGSTLQLGSVSAIATLTGITTVGDFRAADMAAGGQGAPLVPWADDVLLSHRSKARCVQNIGGIANVTYLSPRNEAQPMTWNFYTPMGRSTQTQSARNPVIAFDTGPGNMLIDAIVAAKTGGRMGFDRNGRLALTGLLDQALFNELKRHPFFKKSAPKSTGREEFGAVYARQILQVATKRRLAMKDLVHTVTRLTAWSIADAYGRFLPRMPDEIILCGGGADNPALVKMLGEELSQLQPTSFRPELRRIDEFGIPNKAKEAGSFALLGAATLDGVWANLQSVTGASRPVILGVIAKPG